jgi:hypothetical protein
MSNVSELAFTGIGSFASVSSCILPLPPLEPLRSDLALTGPESIKRAVRNGLRIEISMTNEKYDRCSTVMGKKDFTDGYIVPHFINITLTLAVCFLL